MGISNIVKYNLETRAAALKSEKKSHQEIADTLSTESDQKITKSTVTRYFDANKTQTTQIIEKHEKLQSKIIDTEVETINRRLKSIDHLWNRIEYSGDLHEIAYATKVYNEAIDSLAKELGKFPVGQNGGVTINNINAMNLSEVPTELLLRWRDEAKCLRG